MKEIQKQIFVVNFEAYDGTIFEDEQECIQYEKSAVCALNKALQGIPQVDEDFNKLFNYDGTDDHYILYFPRNVEDIKFLNQRAALDHNSTVLTEEYIGKGVIGCYNYENNFYLLKKTLNEFIKEYTKMLENK